MVRSLAGYGLLQSQIAMLVTNPQTGKPIAEKTLREHFREDLDIGMATGDSQVLQSLFFQAVGRPAQYDENKNLIRDEMKPVPAATIFSCKARSGIKMSERMEFTGKNGDPLIPDMSKLTDAELEIIDRAQRLIAGLAGYSVEAAGPARNSQTTH